MRRKLSFAGFLLLLLAAVAVPCPGWASTATVFQGSFVRATGEPFTEHRTFDGQSGGWATISVINGNMQDSYSERVSSSVIRINGQVVFSSSDFNQNISLLKKDVYLTSGQNDLEVLLKGKPMGMITVLITTPVVADKAIITGIVPGTIAEAIMPDGTVIDRNIASGNPKRWVLYVPLFTPFSIRLIENEGTPDQRIYILYNINSTNVFEFGSPGFINFGVLIFDPATGRATTATDVVTGSGATQAAVSTANISGTWQLKLTVLSSTCGLPVGLTNYFTYLVVQNINSVAFYNALDPVEAVWWGTISGNILALSRIFQAVDPAGNVMIADVEIRAIAGIDLTGQAFVQQTLSGTMCLTVNDFLATR